MSNIQYPAYLQSKTLENIYSGPFLSGHSQEKPPSLMWPEIFVAPTMNAFILPLTNGHLSNVATNFLANRVALLQRDYCIPSISNSKHQWWTGKVSTE